MTPAPQKQFEVVWSVAVGRRRGSEEVLPTLTDGRDLPLEGPPDASEPTLLSTKARKE
jgi:hypothetical protein